MRRPARIAIGWPRNARQLGVGAICAVAGRSTRAQTQIGPSAMPGPIAELGYAGRLASLGLALDAKQRLIVLNELANDHSVI